jgi:cysteine desulfurase
MGSVYLDHNATTPVRPEAAQAMADALASVGNPSSVHGFGRAARRRVEEARESVAALVGACAEGVVFTSGGTEANALALRGCARPRLLVSAVEHDSVLRSRPDAEIIPVDTDGRVIVDAVAAMLAADPRPALVSVMLANNETGAIQPVAAVAERARAQGALVHCDATQAAGKLALSIAELGVDFLTLSAHKLGGPQGVGALVIAGEAELAPLLLGGGQERSRRAGTENVPAIAAFGVAAELAAGGLDGFARLGGWRDAMERRVTAAGGRIIGGGAPRLANTSCLALPGISAEVQVMALDLAGVAVSAGSACSSGKVKASHVLAAMGVAPEDAGCAIRVSLGWNSAEDDVERFVAAWTALATRKANKSTASAA